MSTQKFCRDCKHYRPHTIEVLWFKVRGATHLAKCAAKPDPVTGEPGAYCDIERRFDNAGLCRPAGNNWETKQ
jgi:hypothetical protein